MILLVILILFSLLILLLGFLDIKMPFIYARPVTKLKSKPAYKQPVRISEKLVKDSVDNTLLHTKFLKEKIKEDYSKAY